MWRSAWLVVRTAEVAFPAAEVFVLVALLTLALLFRLPRCGIMAAYVCAYRWCWPVVAGLSEAARLGYMFFGVAAGALVAAAMILESRH